MASARFRIAGLILVFIISLLALERLCSANAHSQLENRANDNGPEKEPVNCDEFGYGRKGLGGRNGCDNFHQKPETTGISKTTSAKLTSEVYQLMRRDYGVHGKPRRKPPINNREPTN